MVDVAERPLPSIYEIDLQTGNEIKITSPSEKEGDFYPLSINDGNRLLWIRTDREKATVFIGDMGGKKQKRWIDNIDMGTRYYGHWNWDEVFSLYQPNVKI